MPSVSETGDGLPRDYRNLVMRRNTKEYGLFGIPANLDAPDMFESRKRAEIWLRNNLSALVAAGVRDRKCVCCGAEFFSHGFHNRTCRECRVWGPRDA